MRKMLTEVRWWMGMCVFGAQQLEEPSSTHLWWGVKPWLSIDHSPRRQGSSNFRKKDDARTHLTSQAW